MGKEIKISIKFLREAAVFIDALPAGAQKKLLYVISRVAQGEIHSELFKKLDKEIWEFRAEYAGMAYRLLAFWDKEGKSIIVATHGFNKKRQKTSAREISRAKLIMKEYYNS